jgi:hypothetical protein
MGEPDSKKLHISVPVHFSFSNAQEKSLRDAWGSILLKLRTKTVNSSRRGPRERRSVSGEETEVKISYNSAVNSITKANKTGTVTAEESGAVTPTAASTSTYEANMECN